MSAKEGIELLRQRGLRPKKSFGQNFLVDDRLCARIAELATTPPGGCVLEIGAGLGALTGALIERARRVIAVERDRDLIPILREQFEVSGRLQVVEADAARCDWRAHLEAGPSPRVVAGNLPYAITGRLVERVVAQAAHLDRAVLMVQLEVGERLTASAGTKSYGAASVFAQAAFSVERCLRVPAGAFWPTPGVDSTVVVLTPHRSPRAEETAQFREVVKQAFAHRRKTLRNAWRELGGCSRSKLERLAIQADIDLNARGETLDVEAFARMARLIAKEGSESR